MKLAIKYWEMFFNSKVAVTIVTLAFGLLASYNVYDYTTEIEPVSSQPSKQIIIQSIPCDNKEHKLADH